MNKETAEDIAVFMFCVRRMGPC